MKEYKVKQGDTLGNIAKRYNVDVGDISGYRSGNQDLIFPDELLSINLGDLQNTPEVTTSTVPDTEKPYNGVGKNAPPVLDYVYNKADEDKYTSFSNKNIDKAQDISSNISDLYSKLAPRGQDKVDLSEKYGIPEQEQAKRDAVNRLKLLQSRRDIIPMIMQDDAEGRGITKSGLAPHEASELRKNAIAQYTIGSEVEAYNNNLQSSIALRDAGLDEKYAPIEYELENALKDYDNLITGYRNTQSQYSNTFTQLAKLRKEQLEKDREEIYKAKAFDKAKTNLFVTAYQNKAPAHIIRAIESAETLADAIIAAKGYSENVSRVSQRQSGARSLSNQKNILNYKQQLEGGVDNTQSCGVGKV